MARGGRGGGNRADTIQGTNGDDLLEGFDGSFLLIGGKGNDTYVVDDPGDSVDEKNKGGTDKVIAYVDYVLGANLENLELAGTDDLSGTGNDDDNEILGNAGDNTLTGGAGSDVIDGGAGEDTAVFSGLSTDYQVAWDGNDLHLISPAGETNILRNVEFLLFDDGIIAVSDLDGDPGDLPPPVAVDDSGTAMEDNEAAIDVLVNDLGSGLSIAVANNGAKGLVSINADGSLTYRPNENAFGTDSFTYTISDELGRQSTATVTIDITADNDAPVASADSYTTTADTTYQATLGVLANDSDVDGDPLSVVGAGADANFEPSPGGASYQTQTAAGGSVSISADGTFTYTPPAGFSGSDSFVYAVGDGNGATDTATVTLTVNANDPDPSTPPYYVDALMAGDWHRFNQNEPYGTSATVTFAFAEATPDYYDPASSVWNDFQSFSTAQREAARDVLDMIASFSGLTFIETSVDNAEMVFGIADIGASGLGFWPTFDGIGKPASDVWLDDGFAGFDLDPGTQAYKTLIHEIGHAIGLKHPTLQGEEDTRKFTVMAGDRHPTMGLEEPSTYMLYDLAAVQYLYGANDSFASGADVYRFEEFDSVIRTIWDGGGRDLFDLSTATNGVDLDLREGAFSTISSMGSHNVAIAFGSVIEDAVGGIHDDRLVGNSANNVLSGGGGSNIFGFASEWGDDIVTDFTRGEDQLDFTIAGLSFADLSVQTIGGDTILAFGGSSVTLLGVTDISGDDLIAA